jgi:hypothetical protein
MPSRSAVTIKESTVAAVEITICKVRYGLVEWVKAEEVAVKYVVFFRLLYRP